MVGRGFLTAHAAIFGLAILDFKSDEIECSVSRKDQFTITAQK